MSNWIGYLLIILGAALRFLPHAPNFAPITAIALFGGMYLSRRSAIALPLAAMLASDYFIGFYNAWVMASVYLSFAVSGFLGIWLRGRKNVANTLGVTLVASLQFYLLTNFAVWAFGTLYPKTPAGLLSSYVNALPFFRNTLLGDVFYVGALFGTFELVRYLLVLKDKKGQLTPHQS
ncbi:MAG: hypothetical protein UY65_C0004G0015 [Parcubacteria group bacterium GW2011_GWA2_51_12]|nr:MAG: hypothetical protein UY65_C0004G0015 [Parcubacteria group bacterium GW2011_GWA2_51_12]